MDRPWRNILYIVVWLKFILFFMSSYILYFMTAYWLIRNLCIWKIKAYTHVRLLVFFYMKNREKRMSCLWSEAICSSNILAGMFMKKLVDYILSANWIGSYGQACLLEKLWTYDFRKSEKNKNFKYEKGGNYTNFHFINDLFKFELFMG